MPNYDVAPYDPRQQQLQRRRALAMALQQQAIEPIETPPGGAVSWTQGAAKLVQALMAGLSNRKLDREQAGLYDTLMGERKAQAAQLVAGALPAAQGGWA